MAHVHEWRNDMCMYVLNTHEKLDRKLVEWLFDNPK